MSVQEYLDKHMLSRKIEDAVNAAVRAKTSDPVLFIVRFLLLRENGILQHRFDLHRSAIVFWFSFSHRISLEKMCAG